MSTSAMPAFMAATAAARPHSLSVWRPLMTSGITVRKLESFVHTICFKYVARCAVNPYPFSPWAFVLTRT
jgi:hypothetical protein